jgi:phenylalanyl-tRNA synthetase alpha chain
MESPPAEQVRVLGSTAVAEIGRAASVEELEKLRVRFLGKKGEITQQMRLLGQLPAEARPAFGQVVNEVKVLIQNALAERTKQLQDSGKVRPKSWIDVTLPGIRREAGHRHPLLQTMEELKSVLLAMGFGYDDYPEIEEEWFNFDSLNTPQWHSSRDMHDSFYTEQGNVMRTHTSAFQVRAMRALGEPPIRAMTSGRCYRRDQIDATHFPVFHQIDVIAIDRNISFADLKWTLYQMLTSLLGNDIALRFRPSYFPFTTPSAEVDTYYNGRWMELLGSGMIRPEVLRNGGIDPERWQGFAFGIGIERVTMARFNVDDIRLLYDNEAAFLSQF